MAITPEALHRVGIQLSPDEFEALVLEAVEQVGATGPATAPLREFTNAEASALAEGGFSLDSVDPGPDDPLARTTAEYAALLATSLSAPEVSRALGVDSSRVRQRLAERTLYGIKLRGGWRLPAFQFEGQGLLPGIDQVLPHLDPELHPVAVYRWFATPNPDLVIDEGDNGERIVSPRDWLHTGRDPSVVAEIAAEL